MNLARLAEQNVVKFGCYDSIIFGDRTVTNVEQVDYASRFATALAGIGVTPGDRVGVLLPNTPEVGSTYGAILRIGAVAMPMVFLLAIPEITHILADSAATAIITSPEFLANVQAAAAPLPRPPMILVTGDAPPPDGVLSVHALISQASESHPILDRAGDDLAVISYTSGTTGTPKGVMLTHANLLFNAENSAKVTPTRDGDISIGTLPLAHLFGIGAGLVGSLFKIKAILLPWFTAEGFFDAVTRYHATSSALVPTMVAYMLAHPDFDAVDWSSFEWTVVAAAPVSVELADEFERRTGSRVLEGYGLTETSPTCSVMRLQDARRPGSCGRPVPNIEVAILDENGALVPAETPGEVCVRGPNVTPGYYNLPEETAAAMRGGWFHSGDIGHLDADGFLYITERLKDMIIRGGFNIYPRDIEEVLYGHPSVLECAAVGVPDKLLGEEVKAFVVLRPGEQASETELLEHCRAHLAKYKTPSSVQFLDVLPKNPVGKILKRELRARA